MSEIIKKARAQCNTILYISALLFDLYRDMVLKSLHKRCKTEQKNYIQIHIVANSYNSIYLCILCSVHSYMNLYTR